MNSQKYAKHALAVGEFDRWLSCTETISYKTTTCH